MKYNCFTEFCGFLSYINKYFFLLFLLIFPLILAQMTVTWLLLSSALWLPRVFLTHMRLPSWATSSCTLSQEKVEFCFKNIRSDQSGGIWKGLLKKGIPLTGESKWEDGRRPWLDREVENCREMRIVERRCCYCQKNKVFLFLQTCHMLVYSVFISQVTQSRASWINIFNPMLWKQLEKLYTNVKTTRETLKKYV